MTYKKVLFLLSVLFVVSAAGASVRAQRFFNLTAEEVRIDSVLPFFSCSVQLDGAWEDSVYTATIEYPEFIEMGEADVARYERISGGPLPELPEVEANVVVERRRGRLEVSFVPLVMRGGKYMKLVSFMIDVKSSPQSRAKVAARMATAASRGDRYAAHSVLREGRWAKIRVPETGVYEITQTLVRRAGFTDLSRVKVYGYGGALQDEVLDEDYLIEHDDLKEVPTCTVGGRRLFHAEGPVTWDSATTDRRTRNPYSDYGYYFLTESDGEPLTVDSAAFIDSFREHPYYYHSIHEVDNYAWYQGGRNLFENDPISAGRSRDYLITREAAQAGTHWIDVCVTAGQATSGLISINGSVTGTFSLGSFSEYDDAKSYERVFSVTSSTLTDTVTITTTSGGPVRLDYISARFETPRSVPSLATASFPTPEYVYNITNQDHHADPQADMIIIVPTSAKLTAQAQRLKEHHEQQDGLRVTIVPADERVGQPPAYVRVCKPFCRRLAALP